MDEEVTRLLNAWGDGDSEAKEELMPLVYHELRKLARSYLRSERPDHTLQPTALVNEAYLRLVNQKDVEWQSRKHFFGIAAQLMRRILVDYARKHRAEKRGGGDVLIQFEEEKGSPSKQPDLLELDEALTALQELDPRQARVVELKYFAGLSNDETAEALEISPATVKREWVVAKAWLRREMKRGGRKPPSS